MAICKFCGGGMDWGRDDANNKWVPLVPVAEHDGLDRQFQDGNGVLRAQHRLVCNYTPAISVTRLQVPVKAEHIIETPHETLVQEPAPSRRREQAQRRANRRFERDMTATGDLPA